MENLIVAGILIVLISTIIFYFVKEKKKGRKCIGCPYAKQCGSYCNGGCDGDCNHNITHKNKSKGMYV